MYVRLARREEREVLWEFGEPYRRYMDGVPPFLPSFAARRAPSAS
jgi:protein-S-isoprenylcysteine O-methyltransferase Ste14